MESKRSETFEIRTIRKESLDTLIENAIRHWEVTHPEEAKAFYRQCEEMHRLNDQIHDPRRELWFEGRIPSSLEHMIWRICSERLGDQDLARFFRHFEAGRARRKGRSIVVPGGS